MLEMAWEGNDRPRILQMQCSIQQVSIFCMSPETTQSSHYRERTWLLVRGAKKIKSMIKVLNFFPKTQNTTTKILKLRNRSNWNVYLFPYIFHKLRIWIFLRRNNLNKFDTSFNSLSKKYLFIHLCIEYTVKPFVQSPKRPRSVQFW